MHDHEAIKKILFFFVFKKEKRRKEKKKPPGHTKNMLPNLVPRSKYQKEQIKLPT